MDGGETWRFARIYGVSVVYPDLLPSKLVNMAPPKVLVMLHSLNNCVPHNNFPTAFTACHRIILALAWAVS